MPFSYIIGSTVRENGRKGKCMKAAIIKRTCIVLIVALLISGVISGMVCYRQFRREIQEEMVDVLQVIDTSLDRDKDTGAQLLQYRQAMERKYRITLIAADGTVLADTNVSNVQTMENHLARPEIQEAKRKGVGYENRSSDTFVTSMFYVALYSPEHGDFLRLALESAALGQVLAMTVQVFIFSALAALFLAVFLTNRLARSITDPLMEISREMSGFGAEGKVFHFRTFPYRELNVIADTTTSMSKNVRDYLQKLEKEKQVRQEFFSNASHELKTPLTAIRGYTELLQSGMAADPAMQNEFLERIHREVNGMTDLVNDILMISRLETKESTPNMANLRVYLIAEDVIKAIQPVADEAQVTIHLDCAPVEAYMSQKHLEEILSNLISNAVKYNRPGGSVSVEIRKDSDTLYIRVEDTGIGISAEDQPRVFERFFRADKGRSKRISGTGLGLAIVKHIVGYYGGIITLSSTLGTGSCFTVQLPAVPLQKIETEPGTGSHKE